VLLDVMLTEQVPSPIGAIYDVGEVHSISTVMFP
jgi:hypothetical protein